MKYEQIQALSRPELEATILRDNPTELITAVLSVALYAADAVSAEAICVRLASHHNENVRGNALLGLGHIARLHRQLTVTKSKPLIEVAFEDNSAFVRQQAASARDDVNLFLGWQIQGK